MKKIFIAITCFFIVLLGIGTFFDLEIAKVIFFEGNGFSDFLYYGAVVVFAVTMMGSVTMMLFTLNFKESNKIKFLLSLLAFLIISPAALLQLFHFFSTVGVVFGLMALVVIIYRVKKIPTEKKADYYQVALAIFVTVFCSILIVELTKPVAGRVRFRSMQENFDLFTPWYSINGNTYLEAVGNISEEIKSFPSGHSQWGMMTIAFSFFCLIIPKWKSKEKIVFLIAFVYGLLVMLSRMMMGAHFLSDVAVGGALAFIFYLIARKFIMKKYLG